MHLKRKVFIIRVSETNRATDTLIHAGLASLLIAGGLPARIVRMVHAWKSEKVFITVGSIINVNVLLPMGLSYNLNVASYEYHFFIFTN